MDAIALLGVAALLAQEPSGLAERVRAGQTVIVVDTSGRQTAGTVQTVSDSRLVVDYGASEPRAFTIAEIERVRRHVLWDGAIKGAVIGVVPALLGGLAECEGCPRAGPAARIVATGAVIGFAIDVLNGPDTVYRRRVRRVALQPSFDARGAGLRATIRF